MDKTGDVVQPDVPGFLKTSPLAKGAPRIGSGRVAGGSRQSADRPRVRQPALETLLWARVIRCARRRWFSGRTPDASRAARLVGGGRHGVRLEHQARGSPDHHLEHLPTDIATRGTTRIARPVQPAGRTAGPIPAGRRVGPRQRARRQRAAVPADWRPQRQAVPTGRLLGQPAFPQAHLQARLRHRQYRRGCTHTGNGSSSTLPCWRSTPRPARNAPPSAPLQHAARALVMLNDPSQVEAARAHGRTHLRQSQPD